MVDNKHAYLIITHANPYVLEKLLLLIDDERNDIYIHVDKKSSLLDETYFTKLICKSKIHFVTPRIDVRWGDVSQIKVELKLFQAAASNCNYAYYHLISGGDLPIKSQDYIHDFFEENAGTEFIGFSNGYFDQDRVEKNQILLRPYAKVKSRYIKYLIKTCRKLSFSLQNLIGYNHTKKTKLEFVFGCNWVSITHSLVCDLLAKEQWILKFYNKAYCADEIYKHTFVFNSDYKSKVCDLDDELGSNKRLIDWFRGTPYVFRKTDWEEIANSKYIFARKFDDNVDKDIVDKIFEQNRSNK